MIPYWIAFLPNPEVPKVIPWEYFACVRFYGMSLPEYLDLDEYQLEMLLKGIK